MLSGILYNCVEYQIKWYHVIIVKNDFKYQFMFKYDGIIFDREWYNVKCLRNTKLVTCSYVASYLLCLFTAHHVTICSYNCVTTTWKNINYGTVGA